MTIEKFEAGKYYKRRDGRWFYLAVIMPPNPKTGMENDLPLIGYAQDYGRGKSCLQKDGTYRGRDFQHDSDLIDEWREPVSRGYVIRMYGDSNGNTILTIDHECGGKHLKLLSKVERTITEGEGMT